MKIGIDIRTLMDKTYSGVALFTWELVNEILKTDKKNQYILFGNSLAPLNDKISSLAEYGAKIIHTRWPNKIFNYILEMGLRRPKIDSKIGVDIFFMPHLNFISLSAECRKIITVHDLSFFRYPSFFTARKNLWHRLVNVRRLLQKFDCIVAVSENTKKDIIELAGVDAAKIKVVYSGLNGIYGRENNREMLEKIKVKYRLPDKFILFLGTIEPRKNVSGAIKAFELLQNDHPEFADYWLVIAGAKGWKSRAELKFYGPAGREMQKKIKCIGYVDEADKPSLYSLAEVLVYPSFYEGFGFPPLEALACGCPVLTSNSSSLPETIGNLAVTINPYDAREIESGLTQILKNVILRKKIIANSGKVAATFDWQKTANFYLEIFNNIR